MNQKPILELSIEPGAINLPNLFSELVELADAIGLVPFIGDGKISLAGLDQEDAIELLGESFDWGDEIPTSLLECLERGASFFCPLTEFWLDPSEDLDFLDGTSINWGKYIDPKHSNYTSKNGKLGKKQLELGDLTAFGLTITVDQASINFRPKACSITPADICREEEIELVDIILPEVLDEVMSKIKGLIAKHSA